MAAQGAANRAAAQALFDQGRNLMKDGKFDEACPKLEESQRLDPAIGTQFNLASCYEKAGKTASAWTLYLEVAAETRKLGQTQREEVARSRAKALEQKLSRLVVTVPDAVRVDGMEITRGDMEVGKPLWGVPMPVDPGRYTVTVSAPGKKPWKTDVVVKDDAATVNVDVPPLVDAPPGTTPEQPGGEAGGSVTTGPGGGPAGGDTGVTEPGAEETLSHDGQLGALLRADIDGKFRGAVFAVGVSYGLGDLVELGVAGLIGRDKGVEPSATFYFSDGAVKPRALLGVPMFFIDGAKPGVRGGLGLQIDFTRNVGAFVDASLAYFPGLDGTTVDADDRQLSYPGLIFVPSVGLQTRM